MAEPIGPPPLAAPPPIRSARPPSTMHALAQVQQGRSDSPPVVLQDVGRKLLTLMQAHPELRPKLTQALQLITEAVTEGLAEPGPAGGPPPGPGGPGGPLPPRGGGGLPPPTSGVV